MAEHAFKPVLIDLLRQAYRDQEAFIAGLDAAERAAVGSPDHWTAKDHVAHMTFWRQCAVQKLAAALAHETPPSFEPFEAYNQRIFAERRDWSWPRKCRSRRTRIWSPILSGSPKRISSAPGDSTGSLMESLSIP